MADNAIQIEHVSKIYQVYDSLKDRLKQSLWWGNHKFYREFWAVRDVSLTIPKGETVGLIGRNGSGKSTLLQMIVGTLTPSSGSIHTQGRIAALLELGSGFNPELTGRENVRLQGLIMGLGAHEIEKKLPEIEQFAEIGDFIDQPVKMYSSGMFVRLAFACAVNVDPDILVVDEALAVGDMHFQLKCIDKMKAFKKRGKTILFVSHDIYAVKNFCNQAIWMMDGKIHLRGDVNLVADEYQTYMRYIEEPTESEAASEETNLTASVDEGSSQVVTIHDAFFYDKHGEVVKNVSYGEPWSVRVDYTLHKPMKGLVGGIAVYDSKNTYVCGLNTKLDQYILPEKPGGYQLWLEYGDMRLLPGTYFIDIGFFESSGVVSLDYKSRSHYIRIQPNGEYFAEGLTFLPHTWSYRLKSGT